LSWDATGVLCEKTDEKKGNGETSRRKKPPFLLKKKNSHFGEPQKIKGMGLRQSGGGGKRERWAGRKEKRNDEIIQVF